MFMKRIIFFGLVYFAFVSCEDPDPLPAGITTHVSGKILELGGEPVVKAKIRIGEYRSKHNFTNGGNDEFQRWIDSTYTDVNGKYELDFTTTGNGTLYKIDVVEQGIDEVQTYMAQYVDEEKIEPVGTNFTYNPIGVYNVYPCDVYLDLKKVTQFPIYVNHYSTNYAYLIEIKDVDDYKIRLYLRKNTAQTLNLSNSKGTFKYNFAGIESSELTEHHLTLSDDDFIK